MSARSVGGRRASARPLELGARHRALALLALIPLAATVLVHAASAADPLPTVRRLDAATARRSGLAVELRSKAAPPAAVLEVREPDGSPYPGVLLDATPDGHVAAIADTRGASAATVSIARADGSQLRAEVEGVLAATLSDDGSRAAVVDGVGRLWTLDVARGEMRPLADGPFIDAPLVEADGAVLALSVPSVEAPFQSRLVRITVDGHSAQLSDEQLVYAASPLADGSLAVVVHRPGRTVVLRRTVRETGQFADLGEDAVNVSLSRDGSVIAWETAGQAFATVGHGSRAALGAGSIPRVAPDGASVLVHRDGEALLLDLEGNVIGSFAAASTFLDCAEECQP